MIRTRTLALLFLAAGCATPADHSSMISKRPNLVPTEQAESQPMLLLGSGPYYLATDQGYFEADMIKSGQEPGRTYTYDRLVTGEKFYTVVPEAFPLAELTQPAENPRRKTFKADLVRGRPGHGGSTILTRLTFRIKRVVHALKGGPTQRVGMPHYLVFGSTNELFAARLQNDGPTPRQILSVRVRDGILNSAQARLLTRGAFVRLNEELRPGIAREAEARVGPETLPVAVETLSEIYASP